MAITTGINITYSSAYRALPQKALPLGSPSTVYEPLQASLTNAGTPFRTFFQYAMPVGFGWASATVYDVLYLCQVGGNYSNAVPNTVNPGYRISQICLRSSGNAGVLPVLVGFATANNIFNANANTSGYLGGGALTVGTVLAVGTLGAPPTGSTIIQSALTGVAAPNPSGNLFNNTLALPVLNVADTLVLCTTAAVIASGTAITIDGYIEYYLTGPTGF